jgi:hypothetical protein
LASAIAEEFGLDADELSACIEKTSGVQVDPVSLSPPTGKGVYAITDCSVVLAGETKDIKDHLNSLNPPSNGKKAVEKKVVYIPSSPVGPCWVLLDNSCMSSIKNKLKEKKLSLKECSTEEYNESQTDTKPKDTAVKGKNKAPTTTAPANTKGKGKAQPASTVVDTKGKGKAQPASTVVDTKGKGKAQTTTVDTKGKGKAQTTTAPQKGKRHEVSKNAWDNNEDPDSGIVFVELPVGANGVKVPVAVGTQKKNARKNEKGLKTVVALTKENKKVCEEKKWRVLDQSMLAKIKNPPLVAELKTLLIVEETNTSKNKTNDDSDDESGDDSDDDSDDSDDECGDDSDDDSDDTEVDDDEGDDD